MYGQRFGHQLHSYLPGGPIRRADLASLGLNNSEVLEKVYDSQADLGATRFVTIPMEYSLQGGQSTENMRRAVCLSADLARSGGRDFDALWGQVSCHGIPLGVLSTSELVRLETFFREAVETFQSISCAGIFLCTDNPFAPVRLFLRAARSSSSLQRAVIISPSDDLQDQAIEPACIGPTLDPLSLDCLLYEPSPILNGSGCDQVISQCRRFSEQTESSHGFIFPAGADLLPTAELTRLIEDSGNRFFGLGNNAPALLSRLSSVNRAEHVITTAGNGRVRLCSRSTICHFGSTMPFVTIGERINPSGRKRLARRIRDRDFSYVAGLALEQEKAGAHVIDVNIGLPDIDEVALLPELLSHLQPQISLPISIDTANKEAMQLAALFSQGRPLLNSSTAEMESLELMVSCARETGAALVIMTLDENGIPETSRDRLRILERVLDYCMARGLSTGDILFDFLVLSVAAQPAQIVETLETIRVAKKAFSCSTVLGISNVSFGLPSRMMVNRTFLAMAIAAGLDSAIIDPRNQDLGDTIAAASVLVNRDPGARRYCARFSEDQSPPTPELKAESPSASIQRTDIISRLTATLASGEREEVVRLATHLRDSGEPVTTILNSALIPGIQQVGEQFERGELFLPDLMRAAESMKAAFTALGLDSPQSDTPDEQSRGCIILATVKGDMHDLGKNLVGTFLASHGYYVIDLGKNVSTEMIVTTASEHPRSIVGLSALMTSTVPQMQLTVDRLKYSCPSVKIIIGGAVVTAEYAASISADGYGRHAADAVKVVEKLFKEM